MAIAVQVSRLFQGDSTYMLDIPLPYYIYLGSKSKSLAPVSWRAPFDESNRAPWETYMYAFVWEDPREDDKYLDLQADDNVIALTSGGCNLLDMMGHNVKNVWSVDMNPCQNDLFELKLACLRCTDITYEDFWKLFGLGRHSEFGSMLDNKLSPFLSPRAYRFWRDRRHYFEKTGLYFTGHSGTAISMFKFVARISGATRHVQNMLRSRNDEEFRNLAVNEVIPRLLPRWLVKILISRSKWMWKCLGVPKKQLRMILGEYGGDLHQCGMDTIIPCCQENWFKSENYFWYVCTAGEYHPEICPNYLKRDYFEKLRQNLLNNTTSVRINTQKYIDVLESGGPNGEGFSKVILMDHMDWFSEEMAVEEIKALWDNVRPGGKVFWRSAESKPWYNALFERQGFQVAQISVRKPGDMIDRVNMYLSFNYATRP